MKKTIIVLALFFTGFSLAHTDNTTTGRPMEPLMIKDFNSTEAVAQWSGLQCEPIAHTTMSGERMMCFSIPKWQEGEEERPGVTLRFNHGQGFPFQDWSRYGAVRVDAWVEGDQPGRLGLKLLDTEGRNSWTTHITIEPGQVNPAVLSLEDAAADCDITRIEAVVLYALRPETAYTVLVDNLRLLPKEKPPLARFQLLYPNYRGLIFPGEASVEAQAILEPEEHGLAWDQLKLRLSLEYPDKKYSIEHKVDQKLPRLELSAPGAPEGPAVLKMTLLNANSQAVLAEQEWPVRKISEWERDALRVYIDRENNTRVEGRPFFPLGWYTSPREDYLLEVADSPFNCLLAYGTNHVGKNAMLRYLDLMQSKGLKLIYCMNDVYPTATDFEGKQWEGAEGNEAIARAVIQAYKGHPAILAWYLNDELPISLIPSLEGYHQLFQTLDPGHPCYIVLCNAKDLAPLQHTTDVLGVDSYPIPHDPITSVNERVETALQAVHGVKPVWLVPQAFGWYQYHSKDPDRGHTPMPEELRTGRAPTIEEIRCMTYLALTHGAKGLIYYCYYDFRLLPQYPELWKEMKKLAGEIENLFPVLLSDDSPVPVVVHPGHPSIHAKLKQTGDRLYLLAVNSSTESVEAVFDLQRNFAGQADVLFENRKLTREGSILKDAFKPLEAHVYELNTTRNE